MSLPRRTCVGSSNPHRTRDHGDRPLVSRERRFYWLSRRDSSGPARAAALAGGFEKVADAEVVEVAGQRKLLRWTVPGLAHFFTMWGFTVLMTTDSRGLRRALSAQFSHSLDRPKQLAGLRGGLLRHGGTGVVVRLRDDPRQERPGSPRSARVAFTAVTHRAAWMVLVMIALVIVTLLVYRAAQINTGHFPYAQSKWPSPVTWWRPGYVRWAWV